MICAGDFVKAGAGNAAGDLPAALGRYPGVVAAVQHQRRRTHSREFRRDVDTGEHLQNPRCRFARGGHTLQFVDLMDLGRGGVRKAE